MKQVKIIKQLGVYNRLKEIRFFGIWRRVSLLWCIGMSFFCIEANANNPLSSNKEVSDDKYPVINMVNDVSHLYSFFYAWSYDSNFGGKYGYVDRDHNQQITQNQATIASLDLNNYNLFNLFVDLKHDEPYLKKDIDLLKKFIKKDGGGVFIVLGAYGNGVGENANALLKNFGVTFSVESMKKPLCFDRNNIIKGNKSLVKITKGRKLIVHRPSRWKILVSDADGDALLMVRKMGKGYIAVSGFTPFVGQKTKGVTLSPKFRFSNYEYVQDLFAHLSSGKSISKDIAIVPKFDPEKKIELETMRICCSEYSQKYAKNVVRDYNRVYPQLAEFMGVPLYGVGPDKKLNIDLLAVVGSGWSSGNKIAIAMYKDTYYGILGHELTHSWVVPHAEPLSNEGIAIWVGSKVRIAMGEEEEGLEEMNRRIDGALNDPHFLEWDPVTMNNNPKVREKYTKLLRFGKYMYVLRSFEQKYGKDILVKYFRLKRDVIPVDNYKFTCHDSSWLWSQVTGEDQFTFLNSLGITVDPKKVTVPKQDGKI